MPPRPQPPAARRRQPDRRGVSPRPRPRAGRVRTGTRAPGDEAHAEPDARIRAGHERDDGHGDRETRRLLEGRDPPALCERLAQRSERVVDVPERILAVQPVESVRDDQGECRDEHEAGRQDPPEPDRRTSRHDRHRRIVAAGDRGVQTKPMTRRSGPAARPATILDALTRHLAQAGDVMPGPVVRQLRLHRLALVAVLTGALLAACAGAPAGPVTLRLQVSLTPRSWRPSSRRSRRSMPPIPNGSSQLESVPQESESEKVTSQLAAGDLPDVLRLQGSNVQQWIRRERLHRPRPRGSLGQAGPRRLLRGTARPVPLEDRPVGPARQRLARGRLLRQEGVRRRRRSRRRTTPGPTRTCGRRRSR